MNRIALALENQELALSYPESLQTDIQALFAHLQAAARSPNHTIVVQEDGCSEKFSIQCDGTKRFSSLRRDDCLFVLLGEVVHALITDLDSGVALHSGAVLFGDQGILLPGATGAGKSSLTAWLADRGFSYLTDECVVLRPQVPYFSALARPLVMKDRGNTSIAALQKMNSASIVSARGSIFWPQNARPSDQPRACKLFVLPRFEVSARFEIESLSAAQTALELTACNVNARNLSDHGFGIVTSFARDVPAIMLRYGSFDQLQGFDTLLKLIAESTLNRHAIRRLVALFPTPQITQVKKNPRLGVLRKSVAQRGDVRSSSDSSEGEFLPVDFEKIARPYWIRNSRRAVLSPSSEDWVPDAPAAGTELMLAGLKERLGEDLDRINLHVNHPGTHIEDTRPRVVWMHHDVNQRWVQWCDDKSLVSSVDYFVFVSHWQRERYLSNFDLPPERCCVLQNATETNASPREWEAVPVWRCAYTSTPFRGLPVLLDAWHQLSTDNAELHIWSSMKLYLEDDSPYTHLYDRARGMPKVYYHGIVPNAELRAALRHIDFLVYPSTFAETSCLGVIEAMSAGCRVIVPALGALPETTAGYARIYPSVPDPKKHAEILSDILAMELSRPWGGSPELSLSQQGHCAAVYDWHHRANEWRRFIGSIT